MLRRFDQIYGNGIWTDYRWDPDLPDLARLNIIYGPNGSGKSSLSRALDAARSEPNGYKCLSLAVADAAGERVTNTNNDTIFDRLYVFGELYIDRSHRFHDGSPNLDAILTLGERAADAEDQIAKLRDEIEDKTKEAEDADKAEKAAEKRVSRALERISSAVVGDLSRLDAYRSRSAYSTRTVRERLSSPRDTWRNLSDGALTEKKRLITSDNREPLSASSFSLTPDAGLKERAEGLLSSTPVTIVLDTLRSNPEASTWVQDGQPLHSQAERCLFCGQGLPPGRLGDIEKHFSDEVSRMQDDLDSLGRDLDGLIDQIDSLRQELPPRGLLFEDLRDQLADARQDWDQQANALKQYFEKLALRVQEKRADVLVAVDAEVPDVPVINGEEIERVISSHNQRVAQHATLLQSAATEIEQHHLLSEASEADVGAEKQKEEADRAVAARNRISEISDEIAKLEQVDGDPTPSAAALTREVSRLLGRSELVFQAHDGKYTVTRDGEPANNLSVGERTAITLVHFLEVVGCHDPAKGRPIVVIDDPVSSLDSNVFMGISTYIWSVAMKDETAQIVLMTHNFELFKQWDVQIQSLHRGKKKSKEEYPASLYELKPAHVTVGGRVRRRSVIHAWPESERVRKKIRSSYHHAFITVANAKELLEQNDTLENRLDAQLLFPNVIRRLLESFLAFKRPEWVGDFTGAMRNSRALLEEHGYQGDADALRQQLTRYAHAYSHDESPETDVTINPDEIYGAIKSVFVFMNQLDAGHFQGLCEVVGKDPSRLLPEPTAEGTGTELGNN